MAVQSELRARDTLLTVGEPAPDFLLRDQEGNSIRLSDFRGRSVVLFFYPKAFTGGCTAEACSFRDAYEDFKDAGAEVIGISSDRVETQEKFARQYRLPFLLLSDPDESVHQAFGVRRTLGIIKGRATFVIDPEGIVRDAFQSINPMTHMTKALPVLEQLQAKHA
jgi:peroxiredoxin Q/BCP